MSRTRAAICIHTGSTASTDQQERLAATYCDTHDIDPHTIVWNPADALTLIRDGLVDTVVVAYLPADRAGLAEEVTLAGGVLCEARRSPRGAPAEMLKLFIRLFDRGMTVAEIAALTDTPSGEIRAELLRRGRPTR